jgi:hypothetical protein
VAVATTTRPAALAQPSPLAALAPQRPAAVAPAAPAPANELQGIFARLAGQAAPAPAPSALASLWQDLRGGA